MDGQLINLCVNTQNATSKSDALDEMEAIRVKQRMAEDESIDRGTKIIAFSFLAIDVVWLQQ
jgi:hypothetical protein